MHVLKRRHNNNNKQNIISLSIHNTSSARNKSVYKEVSKLSNYIVWKFQYLFFDSYLTLY